MNVKAYLCFRQKIRIHDETQKNIDNSKTYPFPHLPKKSLSSNQCSTVILYFILFFNFIITVKLMKILLINATKQLFKGAAKPEMGV